MLFRSVADRFEGRLRWATLSVVYYESEAWYSLEVVKYNNRPRVQRRDLLWYYNGNNHDVNNDDLLLLIRQYDLKKTFV